MRLVYSAEVLALVLHLFMAEHNNKVASKMASLALFQSC